ncbi:LysR family transcriptional regulator [Micromonospora sp. C28SCA-DRY-2]|uniref:LysR family transcriptional regulator n=1 Tax=Micromonospora sp. C28SCA-DRY-2 TaxID=3059522 RepID=UPI0026763261|nr:LysR family transcriptional regulator [Micromonospora sp. C28SCA-DRY-2]MDO3702762.1 LysR family transcriptional regulator [Micromonospora sp. C28SCA-DRY-2]
MDIEAVRTFLAVADAGQFQEAAVDLRITQQAVSKRVANLERSLGVTLFTRTARGVRLTLDGEAFLPHSRELLHAAERAAASVRPGNRALRVDVLNRRSAPAEALHRFYRAHPGTDLDVVTLADANVEAAIEAVHAGEIDASFRAVPLPARDLPDGILVDRVLDDPLHLLVGAAHPLAAATALTPAALAGHRIWIPGIRQGAEWAVYYDELTEAFDLRIDAIGPNFGSAALLDAIADSADLATLVGAGDRHVWPATHDLRRIPLHGPTPVYPHSFVRRAGNPHPTLTALRRHLAATRPARPVDAWVPGWARRR